VQQWYLKKAPVRPTINTIIEYKIKSFGTDSIALAARSLSSKHLKLNSDGIVLQRKHHISTGNIMSITSFSCPLPILDYDTIQLAHGAGGRLSDELIRKVFLPCFGNETLGRLEDQAVLPQPEGKIAFSTDSFVVQPIFFPGGNIGELAVNGTVNDVVVSGAKPLYLSCGFILEEGLPISELYEILVSMKNASYKAGVLIVTGDTKVVPKGACDKIFINTSGIGVLPEGIELGALHLQTGMKIILSGSIADHGMAVMTKREGLSFESEIESDTAALNHLIKTMMESSNGIAAMRDPTRGGLAAVLNEWINNSKLGINIFEKEILVRPAVRGACEILGIDPLYTANEGKLIAAVTADEAETVLAAMQNHELGKEARIIGEIVDDHPGTATIENIYGVSRVLAMPIGEQLPRIC